ncbi:hypothetical protein FRC03_000553 [Tulasnella sp. 419]|nr:hypothetical protein FRC03_000553 [Tulasnella sp. 419]
MSHEDIELGVVVNRRESETISQSSEERVVAAGGDPDESSDVTGTWALEQIKAMVYYNTLLCTVAAAIAALNPIRNYISKIENGPTYPRDLALSAVVSALGTVAVGKLMVTVTNDGNSARPRKVVSVMGLEVTRVVMAISTFLGSVALLGAIVFLF